MNINPINSHATNFCAIQNQKVELPTEQYVYTTAQDVTAEKPKASAKETFAKIFTKVKNGISKSFHFVKDNKNAIGTAVLSVGKGLLAACTVLGANQLVGKVFKANTSSMANKLAIIGGVGVTAATALKNKDRFVKKN